MQAENFLIKSLMVVVVVLNTICVYEINVVLLFSDFLFIKPKKTNQRILISFEYMFKTNI